MLTSELPQMRGWELNDTLRPLVELIAEGDGRQVRLTKLPWAVGYRVNGRRVSCRGPADFMGLCLRTRRLILFDIIESRSRWRLSLDEASLSQSQRQVLLSYGQDGAIAGLMAAARHKQLQMIFWVPWNALIRPEPMLRWTDERIVELGSLDQPVDFSRVPGVEGGNEKYG